jgi:predicted dehydrogenase
MPREKLRVVVIGCGAIAQLRHLVEYAARPDVELVAVVDFKAARAKEVAARFKVPRHLTDYRKALALKPDAVSVCTPTAYHALHSIAALRAKAHVLCEKPMAGSLAEAKAMIAAAKANRRQLMIGHNQRLHIAHVRGKEILKSGKLGRVLGFSTTFAHAGPEGWSVDGPNCHFFKKRQTVWGSLADLGVHKIDLLRHLLDDDFVQAAAMYGTMEKKNCNVEDTAFCLLKTSRGVMGQMYAGWQYQAGCDNSTRIYCEKGVLRLEDDPEYTVIAQMRSGERLCIRTKLMQTNEPGGQTNSGVIDGFVEGIRPGRTVPIPAAGVLNTLATVVACIESGKTGRTVKVKQV